MSNYIHPPIKSYSINELYLIYSIDGNLSKSSFSRWLHEIEDLHKALPKAKKKKYRRVFTPAQVEKIFNHLGRPELTKDQADKLTFINI